MRLLLKTLTLAALLSLTLASAAKAAKPNPALPNSNPIGPSDSQYTVRGLGKNEGYYLSTVQRQGTKHLTPQSLTHTQMDKSLKTTAPNQEVSAEDQQWPHFNR